MTKKRSQKVRKFMMKLSVFTWKQGRKEVKKLISAVS